MYSKILAAVCMLLIAMSSVSAKELKVLMIGNSFSVCVGNYLPQIVAADGENKLVLTSAYIGGCTLERHYNNLVKAEKEANFKPYQVKVWDSAVNPVKAKAVRKNVNELLKNNQYDVISIQQGSQKSFDFTSYEPYAGEIIKYIRKYQKNAEIVIQQTWSYRKDSKRFPKLIADQVVMYNKLKDAYGKLAAKYQLRVIPMGDAVQIYRGDTPVKYTVPTKTYKRPELPSDAGDVVGKFAWRKNKKTQEYSMGADCHHLNFRGEYMQAALWYMFLFDAPVEKIKFAPQKVDAKEVALLKNCAAKAIKGCKNLKK